MQVYSICCKCGDHRSNGDEGRLNFANAMGINRVKAKSDSHNVINFYNGQSQWWDATLAIFAECVDVAAWLGRSLLNIVFVQ